MRKLLDLLKIGRPKMRPLQESLICYDGRTLKRVYWLTTELAEDPKRVELAQALTLNPQKPTMGLKGSHGLFASSEWWNNINQQRTPLLRVSGVVLRAYEAGQDSTGISNTIDLQTPDGSTKAVGIYVNNPSDIALFVPGAEVELVYALDELKRQPAADGGIAYSKIALEMAVSSGA